jgi:hypothetical protein
VARQKQCNRPSTRLDANNALIGTDLFWQVAGRWTGPHVHLAQSPASGDTSLQRTLRLGLDALDGPGWALTDSAAAAAYGAPLAFRAGQSASRIGRTTPKTSRIETSSSNTDTSVSPLVALAEFHHG